MRKNDFFNLKLKYSNKLQKSLPSTQSHNKNKSSLDVMLIGPEYEENLSLRYLASSLEDSGFTWRIEPFNEKQDYKKVLKNVRKYQPAIIGFSMSFQIRANEMIFLANEIRKILPLCHITAGGHFAL